MEDSWGESVARTLGHFIPSRCVPGASFYSYLKMEDVGVFGVELGCGDMVSAGLFAPVCAR